jgi:hypothetical protein
MSRALEVLDLIRFIDAELASPRPHNGTVTDDEWEAHRFTLLAHRNELADEYRKIPDGDKPQGHPNVGPSDVISSRV